MSRMRISARTETDCFPRVSGDEPGTLDHLKPGEAFSPRERG